MLTAKQRELLDYIGQVLDERGVSPSFEEMQAALGLKSKSGVHRLILALEERGFIRRLPNRARAIEVVTDPTEQSTLRGVVPAYRQSLALFSNKALLDECFRRNLVRA